MIFNTNIGGRATIEPLTVTENGTYTAPEGVDGYSPVAVNIPSADILNFSYTGTSIDNRGADGKGTVRLTSSGTLRVFSKKPSRASVYLLGGGGGGMYTSYGSDYAATGGGGGNQTVDVELTEGSYDVVIGAGGAGATGTGSNVSGSTGGNTTAFGYTSTGGGGGKLNAGGTGGTPNGGNGTLVKETLTNTTIGLPNGGVAKNSSATVNKGGAGYVELTFS